eukprot:m.27861 g.27861  ORF g.27861 m.27861 type:complete len:261 (-) comp9046_c0_seq1:337-1119(-)
MAQGTALGFGSTSFRFDVRGTHPRNKPPGTSISKTYYFSDKDRRLGPGIHDVPMDMTAEDARKRITKSPQDEWSLASNNPKHDHLVSPQRKALRDFKESDAASRGPGFYDAQSFTDTCDLSKSQLVCSTTLHGRSAATPPARLPAHTVASSSSVPASPYHLGISSLPRPRSVSPLQSQRDFGFGRVSSRDDQREMYKSSTFAGNMLQATVNPTSPGMYEQKGAGAKGRTYHSSFSSTTPRFERSATSFEYDNERLRPRHA